MAEFDEQLSYRAPLTFSAHAVQSHITRYVIGNPQLQESDFELSYSRIFDVVSFSQHLRIIEVEKSTCS